MAAKIEQPSVLVVEGREEELFFGALIKHLKLQNIQIMPIGGKEKLRKNLKALANSPGFSEVIGMLEDLCLRAIAQDPAMLCVEQYFECLQQAGLSLPDNMSKAKVQAFLASRRKAGLRLGEAAEKGYWPWDAEAFGRVKDFLQQIGS
jgi:hypothetical protein